MFLEIPLGDKGWVSSFDSVEAPKLISNAQKPLKVMTYTLLGQGYPRLVMCVSLKHCPWLWIPQGLF